MARKPTIKVERQVIQIGVRIAASEKQVLDQLIARAERVAHLAPGTISPAAYARSALLAQMGRDLVAIELARDEKSAAGGDAAVWDWLKRDGDAKGEGKKRK